MAKEEKELEEIKNRMEELSKQLQALSESELAWVCGGITDPDRKKSAD